MTIQKALTEGSSVLKAAGIETPSLDVSLLLSEVTNKSRAALYANPLLELSEDKLIRFRDLILKRKSGQSLAYILGKKEFYGLEFMVNPAVLVPRPDTETLVEISLKNRETRKNEIGIRVLDLCTGSGAVAIALKHEIPELEVWAADISAEALEIAQINAGRLLPPESIHFCQGNLFEALGGTKNDKIHFSLSVSNPPYIPSEEIVALAPEVRCEPRIALDGGHDGLDIIRAIISGAPDFLRPSGTLLLEADPRQMDKITPLMEKAGFSEIQTYPDLSSRQRVIGAHLPL